MANSNIISILNNNNYKNNNLNKTIKSGINISQSDLKEGLKILRGYRYRKNRIKILQFKLRELRRIAQSAKGIVINENGVIDGGTPKSITKLIAEIADVEQELFNRIKESEEYCLDLEKKIFEVGQDKVLYGEILMWFYVNELKLSDIAIELNYSYDWVRHIKREAERYFAWKIKGNTQKHI